MARARNIKPSFFANEHLAECDPFARLLFAGLWCLADREGRLEDRPKRIRAELFPYDNCDADVLLAQLEQHGFITRYAHEEHRYIQVLNFGKHQNPHMKEAKSTIPAQDQTEPTPVEHSASTVQAPGSHQKSPADSLIPDSLSSDSLIPDPLKEPSASASVPVAAKADPLDGFAQFWLAYPRKTARQNAEKAWAKLRPDRPLQTHLLAAVAKQAKSADWTKDGGSFIPHAATWLNGKRWEDEVPCPPGPGLGKHQGFNGERDYKQGLEGNADGTFKF